MNTSMNKHIAMTEDVISGEEESGWTTYLQDYSFNNYRKDEGMMMSSSCSSLISDAAWNGPFDANTNPVLKRLNFKNPNKKNKSKKLYSCDDDLEDTASSPVNSPKVSTLKQMGVNYRRTNDVAFGDFHDLGEVEEAGPKNYSDLGRDDEKNGKNIIDINDEYVDLKKRGMCLVPMSALINYLN